MHNHVDRINSGYIKLFQRILSKIFSVRYLNIEYQSGLFYLDLYFNVRGIMVLINLD